MYTIEIPYLKDVGVLVEYVVELGIDGVKKLDDLHGTACVRVARAELAEANNAREHDRHVVELARGDGAVVAQLVGDGRRKYGVHQSGKVHR